MRRAGRPEEAIAGFQGVLADYPDSKDAAYALLHMGMIYQEEEELQNIPRARELYQAVMEKYPETLPATFCEERLRVLEETE